jgi:hypothetical protein
MGAKRLTLSRFQALTIPRFQAPLSLSKKRRERRAKPEGVGGRRIPFPENGD